MGRPAQDDGGERPADRQEHHERPQSEQQLLEEHDRQADFFCLVLVTDFGEWKGEVGAKRERWFSVPSRPIFVFAGVWRPTEQGPAFAFLTCEPNEIVRPAHPKAMPVILDDGDYDGWLSGEYDSVCALAAPYPSQLMTVA